MTPAKKKGKLKQDPLTLRYQMSPTVGYAEYYERVPLFRVLELNNIGTENVEEAEVSLENADGLFLPFAKTVSVPYGSTVRIETEALLSPSYLASVNEICETEVRIKVSCNKKTIRDARETVTVLPLDVWCGSANPELIAAFVRPRIKECAEVLTDAKKRLAKWGISCEWQGYQEGDKNKIRSMCAAIFSAVKKYAFLKEEDTDLSCPVRIETDLKHGNTVTERDLAVFLAACFESAGLHPTIAFGPKGWGCGAWLTENCFPETVSDDAARVDKFISEGVNELSFIDVGDLYAEQNANFTLSEKHFAKKLRAETYEQFLDIERCRWMQIRPLPLKTTTADGYELLREEEFDPELAPEKLRDFKRPRYEEDLTKDKLWERRLLDLSLKNSLLNFKPQKNALAVAAGDPELLFRKISEGETYGISENTKGMFGEFSAEDAMHHPKTSVFLDSARVELKNHRLHAYADKAATEDILRGLLKKAKIAEEEYGANTLYLAFGFLEWFSEKESPMYAPLVLMPVKLTAGSRKGYALQRKGEIYFNSTLSEFLYREYKIDLRGLEKISSDQSLTGLFAFIRKEILNLPSWTIREEVYLANFFFSRFAMWNDLRTNFGKFRKNPLIASLLQGRSELPAVGAEEICEDEVSPKEILLPLSADSSQFAAISAAANGESFVLHGPPGTGKSQTITNIIANCLYRGQKVLFVAEKQAALSVVEKRLSEIGLGDFCLEAYSGKFDKEELLRKLDRTLTEMKIVETEEDKTEQLEQCRNELNEPIRALHEKRGLGISVYDAVLLYEKNKNAPDILSVESTFYDALTKEKLERYETLLQNIAAAAKESGGAYRSPFDNINVTEYSDTLRGEIYYSAETLLTEIENLKNFRDLFLKFFRQRISSFTEKKLQALKSLLKLMEEGALAKYWTTEEFFHANRRLRALKEAYDRTYKDWIDLDFDAEMLLEFDKEKSGREWSAKKINTIRKRLNRERKRKLSEAEEEEGLRTALSVCETIGILRKVPEAKTLFTDRRGRFDFRRWREFTADLDVSEELCGQIFLEFHEESFYERCRAGENYILPVLQGFRRALENFEKERDRFCSVIRADSERFADADLLVYFSAKAGAFMDNADLLPSWCAYRKDKEELDRSGLKFVTEKLENGSLAEESLLNSFRKNVYRNFIETNLRSDPVLSRFSGNRLEENIERFRLLDDQYSRWTREEIRNRLIRNLPSAQTEGALSVELMAFQRIVKSNMRSMTLKNLFTEVPELLGKIAPCVLMSPSTVAQYLCPEENFDLVIFDEASQLPTCEAIGSLARAKAAVIVGDPKQLPPTSFFSAVYTEEDRPELEDLESILEDCLALGMPQRYLNWHYRSRHESLIAFSNVMYYGSRLLTFPSLDALERKVQLRYVENGEYDKGLTKRNKAEAEALVKEVVERLKNPKTSRSSIGIITFSSAQQDYIERKLSESLIKNRLEEVAYDREEPLFVKNLENVQGDERDVILFSVCYGPDKFRKVSLNFGPLNQNGGWRRLNVAVSRAREEMLVFSSMTSAFIDPLKTTNKGVLGLKAFLEYAEKGKLAIPTGEYVFSPSGLGKYIAEELRSYGYDSRYDVGISEFKIDCAVLDPRNKKRFLLAVLCDGTAAQTGAKDRFLLQPRMLKLNNWNVLRIFTVNFIHNPKREIKRVKEVLDRLIGSEKKGRNALLRYEKPYRMTEAEKEIRRSEYITSGNNDREILKTIQRILTREEPMNARFLKKRCLEVLGVKRYGAKTESKLEELIVKCDFRREQWKGEIYYRKTDRCLDCDFFRTEEKDPVRKNAEDYTPYEGLALAKGILENRVSLYRDELIEEMRKIWDLSAEDAAAFFGDWIDWGVEKDVFVRSVSGRISF